MYTDYLLYLNQLTEPAKSEQLMIMILFFAIMLIMAGILEFIKNIYKNKKKTKKSK